MTWRSISDCRRAAVAASPVASAQVKSALLLAGLQASGSTEVAEPLRSRDHTERMLAALGVPIAVDGTVVRIGSAVLLEMTFIPALRSVLPAPKRGLRKSRWTSAPLAFLEKPFSIAALRDAIERWKRTLLA